MIDLTVFCFRSGIYVQYKGVSEKYLNLKTIEKLRFFPLYVYNFPFKIFNYDRF